MYHGLNQELISLRMEDEPESQKPDGPVRVLKIEDVPTTGAELVDGFEWDTMDLNDEKQVNYFDHLISYFY